jgi:hypothetical protein
MGPIKGASLLLRTSAATPIEFDLKTETESSLRNVVYLNKKQDDG